MATHPVNFPYNVTIEQHHEFTRVTVPEHPELQCLTVCLTGLASTCWLKTNICRLEPSLKSASA